MPVRLGALAFLSGLLLVGNSEVARAGEFDPRYGPDSREAHLAAGASELPVWLSSVQQDVDDARDLDAAIVLGVGNQTRAVMARLGLGR